MFEVFAVTANGLAEIALRECAGLGLSGRAEAGGVALAAKLEDLERLNLWLRSATRVLVRLGSFEAAAFPDLVRKASALPWERFLPAGTRVQVRAACHKSRLYHSGAVAERVASAIDVRVRGVSLANGGDEEEHPPQLVLARLERDVCTVSLDSSGALLHRRGWRGPSAKAPLRETLAAALLLAAGYGGEEPLCDPLCGSGTIAIEAATLAMRRAPGIGRRFAFEEWPLFDKEGWERLRARAREGERPLPAPIEASDQDAGAAAAVRENAAKAGVEIGVAQRRLIDLPPASGAGWIACNPPYGVRVAVGDVWRDLGEALRRRPGFRAAAIVADQRAAGPGWRQLARTENGGLKISLSIAG